MMSPSALYNAIFSVALTFLYVAFYYLSDWMLGNEALGGIAGLIFLPAFIRLFGFLVIRYWIIPALFVAGLFCVDLGLSLYGKLLVSAFLAVGGPFGVFIVSRLCKLQPTLSNLTPLNLLWLSAGCSLGNAIFYHFGLEAAGYDDRTPLAHLYIFIGDMIGTWAVVYSIKFAMDMAPKRLLKF